MEGGHTSIAKNESTSHGLERGPCLWEQQNVLRNQEASVREHEGRRNHNTSEKVQFAQLSVLCIVEDACDVEELVEDRKQSCSKWQLYPHRDCSTTEECRNNNSAISSPEIDEVGSCRNVQSSKDSKETACQEFIC
jgi:hypothetical protein